MDALLLSPKGFDLLIIRDSRIYAYMYYLGLVNGYIRTQSGFVTTAYVLGGVTDPTVIAPYSELYGRSITYQICALLFFIFNIARAVANSLGALVTFRPSVAMAGSCSITIGADCIADMVAPEKRAAFMAAWVMVPIFSTFDWPNHWYVLDSSEWLALGLLAIDHPHRRLRPSLARFERTVFLHPKNTMATICLFYILTTENAI